MAAEQQVPEANKDHTQPPDNASLSLMPANSFFPLFSCSQQVGSAFLQKGPPEGRRLGDLPFTQPVAKVSGILSAIAHEEGKEELLSLESEDEEIINCELLLGQEVEIQEGGDMREEGVEDEFVENKNIKSKNEENEQQIEDKQIEDEGDALGIETQLIGNEDEENQNGNENEQNGNENGNNCTEKLPQNEDSPQSKILQYQNEKTRNEKEIVQNEKEGGTNGENVQQDNSGDISSLTLDTLTSSPLALLAAKSDTNDLPLFSFDHPIAPLSKTQLLCTLNKDTDSRVECLHSLSFPTPPQWKCDTNANSKSTLDNSPPQKRPKISHALEEEVVDDGKATLLQALPTQEARERIECIPSASHCFSHEDNVNHDDDEDSNTCFVVPDEPQLLADDEDIITLHSDNVKSYSDVATMTASEEFPKGRPAPSPLMTKSVLKRGKERSFVISVRHRVNCIINVFRKKYKK